MLRVHIIRCALPEPEADALNRASGEVYSRTLVTHWRAFRRSGHWLSQYEAMRLSDWQTKHSFKDSERLLHAHSIDAAQEGFYKAVKTARTNRKQGKTPNAHYPHKRKFYRTTIWKATGIRFGQGKMLLARAKSLAPVCVDFQTDGDVREVRLVYDVKQRGYFWHIAMDDGIVPTPVEGGTTAAIDMGEIHPVAITDGDEACILSCRRLRSVAQGTCRNLANLQRKMSRCERGGRRFKRLRHAKRRMLARQKRRQRDLLHKVSRATIRWCQERNVGTLAVGDVRDVANRTKEKRRLDRHSRQKMSSWPHGMLRKYLGYKAEAAGIGIRDNVSEAYTTKTCCKCGHRYKPKDRTYRCTAKGCGFVFARDGVGAANILSRFLYEELGKVCPSVQTYRHPALQGKRSHADTMHVAAGARQ